MKDILVMQIGGMYDKRVPLVLRIGPAGVVMFDRKKQVAEFNWDQIDRLSFEDPKRTKANVGALLMFGVLGLASRKNYTLISFASGDRHAVLEAPGLVAQWRAWIAALLSEAPAASGKVFIADDAADAAVSPDPIEEIRRLAELRDQGIVTPAEFDAKKADLLDRM